VSDEAVRDLERRVQGEGTPADRLALARAYERAGHHPDDLLRVLRPGRTDPEVRRVLASRAWDPTHVRRPRLRWSVPYPSFWNNTLQAQLVLPGPIAVAWFLRSWREAWLGVLDAESGELLWSRTDNTRTVAIVRDVLFRVDDEVIEAHDLWSGATLYKIDNAPESTVTVSDHVVVQAQRTKTGLRVTMLRLDDPRNAPARAWTEELLGVTSMTPPRLLGRTLLVQHGEHVYVFDLDTGKRLATVGEWRLLWIGDQDGVVARSQGDTRTLALLGRDLEPLWTTLAFTYSFGISLSSEVVVLERVSPLSWVLLDRGTGTVRATVPKANGADTALARGALHTVEAGEGELRAWSLDGAPLWSHALETDSVDAIAVQSGRLYVSMREGITCLEEAP
jgi:hypothetical protein